MSSASHKAAKLLGCLTVRGPGARAMEEAEGQGLVQHGEEMALGGTLQQPAPTYGEVNEKMEPGSKGQQGLQTEMGFSHKNNNRKSP